MINVGLSELCKYMIGNQVNASFLQRCPPKIQLTLVNFKCCFLRYICYCRVTKIIEMPYLKFWVYFWNFIVERWTLIVACSTERHSVDQAFLRTKRAITNILHLAFLPLSQYFTGQNVILKNSYSPYQELLSDHRFQ